MHFSAGTLPEARLIAGATVFIASYIVFAFGKFPGMKIDRPGMAIIGAVLMVAFRVVGPEDALKAVNVATIVLLFAMMLIVSYLHRVGFFDSIAELVVRRLGSRHLLPAVILSTGVLSAFFVNDIICLVMVPIVLNVTRRMSVPALPYLLAVATASNVGSVATITGNPQNILIGSYSGISYARFMVHLGPIAAVGLFLDWLVLHFLFPMKHQPAPSGTVTTYAPRPLHIAKPAIIVIGVVAGFLFGLPPAFVAAVGAAVVLISRTIEPRHIYDEVDWGLLVFFVGLFVIVSGAEKVGIVDGMLDMAQRWNLHNPAIFVSVTAIMSNLVSNVPAVMLLKSMMPGFSDPHRAWLLLAMASTLAGNLTITGSIANIIVVERAREEVTITFKDYLRAGVPITILTLAFGTFWLYIIG
jgi:Na+/H+ antiporter NhaD/arsenite permease-like protein